MVKNLPSNAGDVGSIPGQGTKSPHAATKTRHSQKKKKKKKKKFHGKGLVDRAEDGTWGAISL